MKTKKEITFQRVIVYVLVTVLFAFAGSVMGSVFNKAIEKQEMYINWANLYPFKNENIQVVQSNTDNNIWKILVRRGEYLRWKGLEYSSKIFSTKHLLNLLL
jgi:phage-related tail protein